MAAELRRDAEFEAFTAGAAGRLLHAATLLTGDPDSADRLLALVLAHVYANWFRMRAEDPYEQARTELVRRFAYRPWWRRPHGGTLDRLSAQERLVVVLRLFEGVAEEQAAAQLGLPVDRVRAICARGTATLRSRPYGHEREPHPARQAGTDGRGPDGKGGPDGKRAAGKEREPRRTRTGSGGGGGTGDGAGRGGGKSERTASAGRTTGVAP